MFQTRHSYLFTTHRDSDIFSPQHVCVCVYIHLIHIYWNHIHFYFQTVFYVFLTSVLVVDNLQPTEIVVSLSALCCWNDPIPFKDDSRNQRNRDRDSRADALTTDSSSVIEGMINNRNKRVWWVKWRHRTIKSHEYFFQSAFIFFNNSYHSIIAFIYVWQHFSHFVDGDFCDDILYII